MSDTVVTQSRPATRRLGMALIGAGRIGTSHGELVANRVPGVDLVLIYDPVDGVAATLANDLGVESSTQSLEDVWADPRVDAVIIAAPARSHTDLVVAAAQAGKHVFVEKPMALTMADVDRAATAAQNAGVVLQVGFNRRFTPGFAAARSRIDEGVIGTPQLLRSVTRDPGPFRPIPQGFRSGRSSSRRSSTTSIPSAGSIPTRTPSE